MTAEKRISTKQHWEDFWERKDNINEVYDNSDRIINQVKSLATPLAGKKILEVGAGTGRDSLILCDAGAEVTVLDYADNSLLLMKQLFSSNVQNVELIKGDAFHLPIKDNYFDLVFHQGLLEHFKDPQPILNENFRILKPGGLILVDVPQKYHIYTIIKHILIALNKWFAGWETEFTIQELEHKVKSAGFEIVKSYGEWMQPGLFYRICREAGLKAGIKLPRYPGGIPLIHPWRLKIRKRLLNSKIALYTGLDIGVVGVKKELSYLSS
jgi:ubiquinone/menaquinone biosynthesis C-methylase UbiE